MCECHRTSIASDGCVFWKMVYHELSKGEVPGTLYGMLHSGWMDSELFSNLFSNNFLKHVVPSRPLMLILDGHSSH